LKVAVASGKGGTGKTTIAVNLAVNLARQGIKTAYVDCDVEEPNGHIFLKPEISQEIQVTVPIPRVDQERCTYCGICAEVCRYNAIAVIPDRVMVFPNLCHNCGGCLYLCPERAVAEVPKRIGQIRIGQGLQVSFLEGRLNIGESQSPPVTKQLKKHVPHMDVVVIDAPPGTSCPVIEAVKDTDYVILVSEPTPFGLNDLKLAVGMVRKMELPFGLIINRADLGDQAMEEYCRNENIEVLMKIPFERKIAESYSNGDLMIDADPTKSSDFLKLYTNLMNRIQNAGTCHSQW
jgi:MinD superfamily P-loop ATPase